MSIIIHIKLLIFSLKDAEKDLSKLQAKNKKEKLVSLGRDKLGKRMSETAVNTSQSTFVPPQNNGQKALIILQISPGLTYGRFLLN